MTVKVGEARDARLGVNAELPSKSSISLGFSAVLQRCAGSLVAGPVVAPSFATITALEPAAGDAGGFARNGMPPEAEGGDSFVIDPLELSLARPLGFSPRDPVKPAAPMADALTVAWIERAVERLSFGGDRRTGIARIELGGSWTGAVLVVRASGREVRLELELAGRHGGAALAERLAARLRARGLAADVAFS
jgi:hypothetical protein